MGRPRATKPTRKQKILLKASGLVPENWLVLKEDTTELVAVSRGSGRTRRAKKRNHGIRSRIRDGEPATGCR